MKSHKNRLLLVGGLLIVIGAVYVVSRPKYGTLSKFGYDITIALESTCSRRDLARLVTIRGMLEDRTELSDRERSCLTRILQLAEAGSWEEARRTTRELMHAQVVAGSYPKVNSGEASAAHSH